MKTQKLPIKSSGFLKHLHGYGDFNINTIKSYLEKNSNGSLKKTVHVCQNEKSLKKADYESFVDKILENGKKFM